MPLSACTDNFRIDNDTVIDMIKFKLPGMSEMLKYLSVFISNRNDHIFLLPFPNRTFLFSLSHIKILSVTGSPAIIRDDRISGTES